MTKLYSEQILRNEAETFIHRGHGTMPISDELSFRIRSYQDRNTMEITKSVEVWNYENHRIYYSQYFVG